MNTEYCFCSVIESPQTATVSPACNCPACCAGLLPTSIIANRSAAVTRASRLYVIIIYFPSLFVQSQDESAARRQRVLPEDCRRERNSDHLHGGVRAFRDKQ